MIIQFKRRSPVCAMATGKVTLPALGIEYLATTGEVVTPIITGHFERAIRKAKNGQEYAFFNAEKADPPMSGIATQPKRFRISIEHLIDNGYSYLIGESSLSPVK